MTHRRFTVSFEVRFPEVDSYGVVWHGHYLAYFEVARNALCTAAGLTPAEAMGAGYKVPITKASLAVKQPARLDDALLVAATLRPPETAKLVMDYEVRRLPLGELLATGTTEQVVLNRAGELLLGFPAPLKKLAERILDHQRGEAELSGEKILPAG